MSLSSKFPPNGESHWSNGVQPNGRSASLLKKPSYSQFPVPPGAPPWHDSSSTATHRPAHQQRSRSRTMEERQPSSADGRVSPYTLSVAAEFSLKRARGQLLAMGETLESAKSDLSSPTSGSSYRTHSRSSSDPALSAAGGGVPRSADGFSRSGDMLGDMRRLAVELRSLRESIDPARRTGGSSVASTSRGSTPLSSPRRLRDDSVETSRTSPRHSRQSSSSALRPVREEGPVIEVQTMRGSVVGQPTAVVRIFRAPAKGSGSPLAPSTSMVHSRSVSDSNGIRIRELDYRGREVYSSPRIQDNGYGSSWRSDDRPDSKQSLHSDVSYHTAYQDTTVNLDDMNRPTSEVISDRISDTATIGRPPTPVTQVRSIGINTEPPLPTGPPPPPPPQQPVLRQRPSRAALLSSIRGGQDGIEIARLHSAVDKLAVDLASLASQNSPDTSHIKRKLQAALDLLEDNFY